MEIVSEPECSVTERCMLSLTASSSSCSNIKYIMPVQITNDAGEKVNR